MTDNIQYSQREQAHICDICGFGKDPKMARCLGHHDLRPHLLHGSWTNHLRQRSGMINKILKEVGGSLK